MTARWQIQNLSGGIQSGYEGNDIPEVNVPSCDIADLDRGVFELFDKQLSFQVKKSSNGKSRVEKVPVFFGVGERWAVLKRNKKLRDKSNALILPIISIHRTGMSQHKDEDELNHGINQATGIVTLKRRLNPRDRDYQNVINRMNIANLSSGVKRKNSADLATSAAVRRGGLLFPALGRNIWEFIVIPTPQFYTAIYEISFWVQYQTELNEMFSTLLAGKLQQLPALRIETAPGYWFVGYLDGDYKSEDNFDDVSESERLIKCTFTLKVRAYTVAPDMSGRSPSVRRYFSCPEISFGVDVMSEGDKKDLSGLAESPAADGADDPSLGYTLAGDLKPRETRAKFVRRDEKVIKDPFNPRAGAQYFRAVTVNENNSEKIYLPIGPGVEIDNE